MMLFTSPAPDQGCVSVPQTMALYKWPALRLAFLPGLTEAIFDAGIATAVFGMPFTLALSLGFILKAVGPGLVVPAMFQLQKQGLGAAKGIPSTVVIAASFDDIVAITGFSIFINVAIATGENAAWQIASGPLQVRQFLALLPHGSLSSRGCCCADKLACRDCGTLRAWLQHPARYGMSCGYSAGLHVDPQGV
jgi:hypothetical protein